MRYEIEPLDLDGWGKPLTDPRELARFTAPWQATLELLGRETELLGAELVVIQVDARRGDIRRDGMLRANARVEFPGVKVYFESKYGPLTYATDRFTANHYRNRGLASWQVNVRAIALGLEHLRTVDRYGIGQTGEQYRGWMAIGTGTEPFTAETAAAFIAFWAVQPGADGFDGNLSTETVLNSRTTRTAAYRAAARVLHPDRGGDADQFARLGEARTLLDSL